MLPVASSVTPGISLLPRTRGPMPERKSKLPTRFACGNAPTGSGARGLSINLLIFLGPRSAARCVNRRTNFGLDAQTLCPPMYTKRKFLFSFRSQLLGAPGHYLGRKDAIILIDCERMWVEMTSLLWWRPL